MVVRTYNIADSEFFQQSRAKRLLLIANIGVFTAVDSTIDAVFAADWLASIDTSENVVDDETRDDMTMEETQDVLDAMAQARGKWNEVSYYIDKAYPNNEGKKRRFGSDDFEEASRSQAKMGEWIKNLHNQCENVAQKADLIAAGYTQLKIDAIGVVKDLFINENQEQDAFILGSPQATQSRIKQYNITDEFWIKVSKASKVVYYGDPVMLNTFSRPEGPQPDPDINLKGKATDTANGSNLKNVEVEIMELAVKVFTNGFGNYSFVSIPPGTYNLQFKLDGYGTVTRPITILASGVVTENVSLTVV